MKTTLLLVSVICFCWGCSSTQDTTDNTPGVTDHIGGGYNTGDTISNSETDGYKVTVTKDDTSIVTPQPGIDEDTTPNQPRKR